MFVPLQFASPPSVQGPHYGNVSGRGIFVLIATEGRDARLIPASSIDGVRSSKEGENDAVASVCLLLTVHGESGGLRLMM
ncbi:hypothetical protein [Bradyrhizobium centrolobii]|uniref:hypothetical protein n=1 Tax=Bradyrhizobium centrolobii TaxID=1505087 RepID=UPI0010A959CD|nr:hypothetical protein [Bradyrhizobium centrolobii]